MASISFRSVIKIRGVNPYVHVGKKLAKTLKAGWKKPMPVLVRLNSLPLKPWRINMMPDGAGGFYLYLHGDVRRLTATKTGDKVSVGINFDSAYRPGPSGLMPVWFSGPLKSNPGAKKAWASLPPGRKKEILRYLKNLKTEEARKRNTERAIRVLSGKKERYMARTWND